MQNHARSHVAFLVFLGGCLGGYVSHWTCMPTSQGAQGPEVMVFRDEAGNARCRVGRLTDKGDYGVEILGAADGCRILVSANGNATMLESTSGVEGGRMSIECRADSSDFVLGRERQAQMAIRVGKKAEGLDLMYQDAKGDPRLAVSAKGDASAIELMSWDDKKRAHSAVLVAMPGVASLDLVKNGKSAAQFAVRNRTKEYAEMAYLLLGQRRQGAYLQAAQDGGNLFELRTESRNVFLQNGPGGDGFGVVREDGSPAIRVGVSSDDVIRSIFGPKGESLKWDDK